MTSADHTTGRRLHKLVANILKTAGQGAHGDGGGLWLFVSKTGSRKWVFRYSFRGKVREAGLGGAAHVSLAVARSKASAARELLAMGLDPLVDERPPEPPKRSFGEVADELLASKASGWRNPKHRAQWRMTLETYAAPLWSLPVDQVDIAAVLAVLKPLWRRVPETAARVRARVEKVLDFAKAHKQRGGDNPAAWRGNLEAILPKRQALSRGHHRAMPYADVPDFMVRLGELESMAAVALRFLILTAARSGEVLGARWAEIDIDAKVWTVPAARMKAGREHRVPLSGLALAILEKLADGRTGEFIFCGNKRGRALSNMSMAMLVRRMGEPATVHGFRSSFRDWAGNETSFPREIAEAALAHATGNAVEQAYRRSDALEKRRVMMEAWARYCEPTASTNVVTIYA